MSYENFAYYYDSLMDPSFYDDYYKFIYDHAKFDDVLELGCGTGEIAIRLAKDNKEVMATDLSSDMLEVTKQKAMYEDVNLLLQRVDMTDFSTSRRVDLILCLCDSINYVLKPNQIIQTFDNVFKSLKDNGTFIFDSDSMYKMNVTLNGYKEDLEDDEFSFHWHVEHLGDGFVHHHLHIKDLIENDEVLEDHYQQAYSIDDYKKWLYQVGFNDVGIFSDFHEYHEDCQRVIFVCKKGE